MAKPNQRKCQDVLCCLIFLAFWAGMLAIGGIALRLGQPQRLVYGNDYQGNTCGVGDFKDRKYTVYPRVNEDFLINLGKTNPLDYKFFGVCVSRCPSQLDVVCKYNTGFTVGVTPYTMNAARECIAIPSQADPPLVNCAAVRANCWIIPVDTASTLFRCIPVYGVNNTAASTCVYPPNLSSSLDPGCIIARDDKSGTTTRPAKSNQVFDAMNTARQMWGRWFGDLARAWWVILLCSVGLALVFGFVWLLIAKWCTAVFVWGTIILIVVALGTLTAYFYYKAGVITITVPASLQAELNRFSSAASGAAATVTYFVPQTFDLSEEDAKTAYKIMGYIFTVITFIVLAMIIFLRRAIATSIKVIQVGAEAIQHLPSLIFFPLTTVVAYALFGMWWIFVAAGLATVGDKVDAVVRNDVATNLNRLSSLPGFSSSTMATFLNSSTLNDTFTQIADQPAMNYVLIYHFFGLLWTTQFIQGFAVMSIAGAVCAWYFSRDPGGDADKKPASLYTLERFPLASSCWRTFRFSMGTIAFGSFFIALLQFIRACLAYIQKKMKDAKQDTPLMRFICCCVSCCLLCIQKCLELITRNAYIYSALKGTSFCESGATVFGIIIKNIWTLAAINILSEVMMFLGKVLIALGCAWVAYAILDNTAQFQVGGDNQITSSWLVILVIVFFAYAVATGFMMVFDISIDSVLICYVVDQTDNNGKPVHMDARKFNTIKAQANADATESLKEPEAGAAGGGAGAGAGGGAATGTIQLAGVPAGYTVAPVVPGSTTAAGINPVLVTGHPGVYENPALTGIAPAAHRAV